MCAWECKHSHLTQADHQQDHYVIWCELNESEMFKDHKKDENYQLWGGCFQAETAAVLQKLNFSLPVDKRLYKQDIKGSKAYAAALFKADLLDTDNYNSINNGLAQVLEDFNQMRLLVTTPDTKDEDIHTFVEQKLLSIAGPAALRLHTGRSRNDQVATDTRLWEMEAVAHLKYSILGLIQIMADRAKKEIDIIMPGYTHLQRAQPIRWSHFLLSHIWVLQDDVSRLDGMYPRLAQCPLGSGAIAGCAFQIDRLQIAKDLGFQGVTPNSMYAVSNRDFIAEFLFTCSLCATHLSKLSEDLIIYSTKEFAFVQLAEEFSTGSSLMPQKRNPDSLELIRGMTGTIQGETFGFMTTMKGLPSTYNKDLQGDKESLFRVFDKLQSCLKVAQGTVQTLQVNEEKCLAALDSSMLATDIAHYLVRHGVPFRTAHHHAGKALQVAEGKGIALHELPLSDFQRVCEKFGEDIQNIWSWKSSVEQYTVIGGTALSSVMQQLDILQDWLHKAPKTGIELENIDCSDKI